MNSLRITPSSNSVKTTSFSQDKTMIHEQLILRQQDLTYEKQRRMIIAHLAGSFQVFRRVIVCAPKTL